MRLKAIKRVRRVLASAATLCGVLAGCTNQTECMRRLGAKNCTELFDQCQKSQTDIQKLQQCTECYNKSCQ